jgi:hypothetical protein
MKTAPLAPFFYAATSTSNPGNFASLAKGFPALAQIDRSGAIVHAALVRGFGRVMLYGGVGIWVLAAISFVTFGSRRPSVQQTSGACS